MKIDDGRCRGLRPSKKKESSAKDSFWLTCTACLAMVKKAAIADAHLMRPLIIGAAR